MSNFKDRLRRLANDYKEYFIFSVVFVVFYSLASYFDFFEYLNDFFGKFESWELDEFIVVSAISFFAVFVFSLLRSIRHKSEIKKNLARLNKKSKYESIISTITQSVHRTIKLEDVLENAVDSLSKNMEIAQHVSILMIEGNDAVLKASRGLPEWFVERLGKIPYPKGFAWKVLTDGEPRYCPDVDQDEYIGPAGREVGTKSYLCVPFKY